VTTITNDGFQSM